MVRIPSEYQEVEYLESTGEEWIDSGVIPDRHLSFHCKFIVYNDVAPAYGNVFGSRLSSTVQEYQLSAFSLGIVSVGNRQANFGFYKNVINTVDFDGETAVTVNGVEKQRSVSGEVYDKSIFLFGIRNVSNITQIQPGRIYELSFGNVASFIPCYRKSDQEPGMYDTVRNQFFTNSGTGRFLVGNDVSHSNVNLMESRRRILLNTPHIKSLSGNALSFKTDVPYEMKECKIHFTPKQEGTGTPSPDNVRPITGWDGVEVTINGTTTTIPFPRTIYGGYVDLVKGEVVEEWDGLTVDDISGFNIGNYDSYNGEDGRRFYKYTSTAYSNDVDSYLCNILPSVIPTNSSAKAKTVTWFCVNNSTTLYGCLKESYLNGDISKEGINDFLRSNNFLCTIKLATPNTIPLTDPPSIPSTLRGLNNITTTANGNIDISFYSH